MVAPGGRLFKGEFANSWSDIVRPIIRKYSSGKSTMTSDPGILSPSRRARSRLR